GPVGRAEDLAAGSVERNSPVIAAEAPPTDPGDLAHRPELVEEARLVAGDPGREHVALQDRCGDRQTGELVDDLSEALEGRDRAERRQGFANRDYSMPGRKE